MDGILALALFALWVFCVVDVLFTPADRCRGLPKLAWLFIVVLLSWLGSAVWLLAGRPRREVPAAPRSYASAAPGRPQYETFDGSTAGDAAADAEFLLQCRARAEEQRARYRESQRDEQS